MSSRFQQAETEGTAPLGAVIPKRPVPEASWVRRKAIFIGRKLRRAFSDLILSRMKCKAACHPQAQPRRRKKQSASPIYNPQASARKKDERTKSFLRAHLRRALFLSPGTARRKRRCAGKIKVRTRESTHFSIVSTWQKRDGLSRGVIRNTFRILPTRRDSAPG